MGDVLALNGRAHAPAPLTVTDVVHDYLTHRVGQGTLSPSTAPNHRSTLNGFARFCGSRPLAGLTRHDIEEWVASGADLRPSTRRSHFSNVRTFFKWAVREDLIETNPTADVPSPRQPRSVPRALHSNCVADLLTACPDVRGRAIVWLMVGMGLRCCEVSRFELSHWNRQACVLTVFGKGDNQRVLPVPAEVAAALDAYLAEFPTTSGPMIRSYRRPAAGLTADALSGMVSEWMRKALVKKAGRDGVSAHALRATAASDVLDMCGDLRVVQEMLGHQNLATTSIYLRRAGLPQMRSAMAGRAYRPEADQDQDGAA